MFTASPIFGWGIDSYGKLLPFYGSDTLLGQKYERAASDLLQFLAEFGIFGLTIVFGFFITFIVRYIRGAHNIKLTNHLLLGCGSVLLFALCDSPFMSPAVSFSFLALFFSALRWAEISRNQVDEIDAARPQLVTHESQRRLPFFNKQYEEKEK
jgi:O-antigen ligase